MLLLRGATAANDLIKKYADRFNTCSSCEEQPKGAKRVKISFLFQYMLLLRGATSSASLWTAAACFNTCSSCEEQLRWTRRKAHTEFRFNTCSSCEEQHAVPDRITFQLQFQYMLLLRGATLRGYLSQLRSKFQYMLLLRGATHDSADDSDYC